MYSSFSPKHQVRIRTALALAWGFLALGGVAQVFRPPQRIHLIVGDFAIITIGVCLVLAAFVATWGIIRNRYRFEWVASWFVALTFLPYASAAWYVFVTTGGAAAVSSFAASLLAFVVYRSMACSAHADRLRSRATPQGERNTS
jgi:hypothetical protein